MPVPPNIEKLGRIQGLGLFKDCRVADSPFFRQYNLVYGFNASGKTTLARIFASLGAGARNPNLPDEGTFEVQLTDGTLQMSTGDLTALRGRVLVFNTDFIGESFLWKDGAARPVFYIGREQADLAQRLVEATAAVTAINSELKNAKDQQTVAERAFTLHKRNVARYIAEQLGLGRRYEAPALATDYADRPVTGFQLLTDDEQSTVRAVLSQSLPLPKLSSISDSKKSLAQIATRCNELASVGLGEITVADLRGHEIMRQWIGDGLKYHQEHDLKNCLFCGNELGDARIVSLGQLIDEVFETLMADLRSISADIRSCHSEVVEIGSQVPRATEVGPHLRIDLEVALDEMRVAESRAIEILEALEQLVSEKLSNPHRVLTPVAIATVENARETAEAIATAIAKVNGSIARHNRGVNNFDEAKEIATKKLKDHLLGEGESAFKELEASFLSAKTRTMNLEAQSAQLRLAEENLRTAVRLHGPAADRITKMIHNYLGRRDLELITAEDGYRLRRNGKLVRGSLSEGEKTAIAICYFITTLEAEGRRRNDLIVVVDDPVSSLDTRALNYSFSILRAMVTDVGQVFLLTHNLQFMNEVRKWLSPKTEKGLKRSGGDAANATAALFLLDAVQPGGPESRACYLRELPKHIRDYESEYHYLLHLILRFVAAQDATEYFYLMPNALRKVLDIFLAFKLPGPDGLGSKIASLVGQIDGMDPARIQALERLAQVESHADNLDDLVSFSSATVEEVRAAAETLLELMAIIDEKHCKAMKSLCR